MGPYNTFSQEQYYLVGIVDNYMTSIIRINKDFFALYINRMKTNLISLRWNLQ